MDHTILEIDNQPWSSLLADWQICHKCNYVYRKMDTRNKQPCDNCHQIIETNVMYFHISIHSLIDLMQELYFIQSDNLEFKYQEDLKYNHKVAIIIFYCSLGEVLLDKLLVSLLIKNNMKWEANKLDEQTFHYKISSLFKTLTKIKWDDIVKELNEKEKCNYLDLNNFYKEVRVKRNIFLHKGIKYCIPPELPEQCCLNISPLLHLFVDLNNYFVCEKR